MALVVLLILSIIILCNSTTYEWNIFEKYGSITQSTIANGISDARNIFEKSPNDIVILIINNGTYNIGGDNSYGIDLSKGIKPGDNGGRFIIKGQGINETGTKLIFTDIYQAQIFGKNVYHTTFQDLHMTRNQYTVTQGTTKNINIEKSTIDISLHSGYPNPNSLLSPTKEPTGGGLFIRQYTKSKTDPHIYANLSDIPWINATSQGNNIWRFNLNDVHNVLSLYNINQYIGVKAKHDGDTYHICGGNDIIFKNILWTQSSRGTLRCGINNILFDSIKVLRSPPINNQTPCMSTNAGGPQLNQPGDTMAYNASIQNSYFECTGDDSIAFFQVTNGSVYNTYIRDSFSNGIRVNSTAQTNDAVCGQNITLVRSVLFNQSGNYHNGCP